MSPTPHPCGRDGRGLISYTNGHARSCRRRPLWRRSTRSSSDNGNSALTTPSFAVFRFTFPTLPNGGALPDGNYRATLLASTVSNSAGVTIAAAWAQLFFFLNGDANRDGRVNLDDFNVLARRFGAALAPAAVVLRTPRSRVIRELEDVLA
jgi:hypothetical protein